MISISKLTEDDRAGWELLFRAYIAFYERELPQAVYDQSWQRFQAATEIHALGAKLDGQLVGITHFLKHPHTNGPDVCYLQDLFTAPAARGKGVARALIAAVAEWAREQGCARVYWSTKESNVTARRLYDQVATFDGFILYKLGLDG